ncbi:MAG: hypothetical protein ACJZ12_05620 [Candidatus Neomarinimicrobiota bacterium]
MILNQLDREQLRLKLLGLMDEVNIVLKNEPNVDSFLDKTKIFDEWEAVLPEREFPIFIIAVLNNIRKDTIISSIISSIFNQKTTTNKNLKFNSKSKLDKYQSQIGDHPFN